MSQSHEHSLIQCGHVIWQPKPEAKLIETPVVEYPMGAFFSDQQGSHAARFDVLGRIEGNLLPYVLLVFSPMDGTVLYGYERSEEANGAFMALKSASIQKNVDDHHSFADMSAFLRLGDWQGNVFRPFDQKTDLKGCLPWFMKMRSILVPHGCYAWSTKHHVRQISYAGYEEGDGFEEILSILTESEPRIVFHVYRTANGSSYYAECSNIESAQALRSDYRQKGFHTLKEAPFSRVRAGDVPWFYEPPPDPDAERSGRDPEDLN